MVEECLRRAPSNFHAQARDKKYDLMVGGDTMYLGVAAGQNTVNIDTWEPQVPTRKENYNAVTVCDALLTVHFVSPDTPYFGFEGVPSCMAMLSRMPLPKPDWPISHAVAVL